jgi:sec-independent protein translocase protein TatA
MGLSAWHLLILALVALLVFGGRGRISSIMGDMAKGIKSFKKGLSEDEENEKPEQPKVIEQTPTKTSEHEGERHKSG